MYSPARHPLLGGRFSLSAASTQGHDRLVLEQQGLVRGALEDPLDSPALEATTGTIEVLVCGAHLSGLPLNHQLTSRQAVLSETTETADDYAVALDKKRRDACGREALTTRCERTFDASATLSGCGGPNWHNPWAEYGCNTMKADACVWSLRGPDKWGREYKKEDCA